jgi:hypothetical protein
MVDDKDAERIAKDLISEIASEWIDTPAICCLQENDSYIFEFVLQPSEVIRYARVIERPKAPSVFRFNPLAEATEIVSSVAFGLHSSIADNARMAEAIIHDNAKTQINHMLKSAPDVFTDAMWQARIIGETNGELQYLRLIGRPDIARGLINSALAMIMERIHKHFGKITQKQKPKISPLSIGLALKTFVPKFEETGQIPSQRQFAKALGVTSKGWRDYLRNHQLGDHEPLIKRWLEERLPLRQTGKSKWGVVRIEQIPWGFVRVGTIPLWYLLSPNNPHWGTVEGKQLPN